MGRTAIAVILFIASLSVGSACEPGKSAGDPSCITGVWDVFLPNPKDPAPNVRLKHLVLASPDDKCGGGVNHDDLLRLQGALQPLAGQAFAASGDAFDVQAEFALTPDKPATFKMQTNAKDTSDPQFTNFYKGAVALTDFHSKQGTVHVLFYYTVTSSAPNK
jgi:hypothetical protein